MSMLFANSPRKIQHSSKLYRITPPPLPVETTHHFNRKPIGLRKPLALPNGIHAETNLSANHLCASIRTLLGIFSLTLTSCTIFLRQDRDA